MTYDGIIFAEAARIHGLVLKVVLSSKLNDSANVEIMGLYKICT